MPTERYMAGQRLYDEAYRARVGWWPSWLDSFDRLTMAEQHAWIRRAKAKSEALDSREATNG